MNTTFSQFVEWAGGKEAAAQRLDCSLVLVRHILDGRRAVSKEIAHRAWEVSDKKFSREALIYE